MNLHWLRDMGNPSRLRFRDRDPERVWTLDRPTCSVPTKRVWGMWRYSSTAIQLVIRPVERVGKYGLPQPIQQRALVHTICVCF